MTTYPNDLISQAPRCNQTYEDEGANAAKTSELNVFPNPANKHDPSQTKKPISGKHKLFLYSALLRPFVKTS